jgi:altronate dehydratase
MAPLALDFASVGRLPSPGDNVAIAIRRLDAGEMIALPSGPRTLPHTVLEGHRFAVQSVAAGEALLSWGLPFAHALRPIAPGDYVSNQSMLDALAVRRVPGAVLPADANFADFGKPFRFDESSFVAAPPVPRAEPSRTFLGYRRAGRRGVGTRNTIVILGTTSRTASFARQLTSRLQALARVYPALDGIVAIAHTEGGGNEESNNTLEILRGLAGFIVHPNVAAVLAIDYGVEPITNARLRGFMLEHDYPLADVPHHFLTLNRGLAAGLGEGERIVRSWLPAVAALHRTPEPLRHLRIALQCGGSDAFSGVSGNPLAGAVVHEAIRHGATGVLTETDESMGAESYMLKNVRDLATARTFMATLDAFREKLTWHGLTPESNPSAGNRFRGLYNIALKSLGAVHKKDPRTRLDTIVAYAQPLREITDPGFTFMNGPGNDLEGIAGPVAAGCNLIIFVTGNGSVTNFPFVPTLKITTTTRRHTLLIHEMDINAGRYLDGEPMETLAAEAFEIVIATASGRKTKGEHAGHSQVSLWRNWRQTDTSHLAELKSRPTPTGAPIPSTKGASVSPALALPITGFRAVNGFATERVALILPTSMCSTQIARIAADRLNTRQLGRAQGISRFVAFTHSEGCGFGGETMYRLLQRTYHGYVVHPNVVAVLLLEHGCEKIPNDVMRRQLESAALPLDRYGWVSVQLDGGIEKAIGKIESWFTSIFEQQPPAPATIGNAGSLTVGLLASGPVTPSTAQAFARVANEIIASGGSILLPESDLLLADAGFRSAVFGSSAPYATLAYGQPVSQPGLHVVGSETDHAVENITGFGGNGAHLVLTIVGEHAQQGHPMIPVVQIAEAHRRGILPADDIDVFLAGEAEADATTLRQWLVSVAQRERIPVANAQGFVDFQLTRGLLGLTT